MNNTINIDPSEPVEVATHDDFMGLLGRIISSVPADVDNDPEVGPRYVTVIERHGNRPNALYAAALVGRDDCPVFHRSTDLVDFCDDISDFSDDMLYAGCTKELHGIIQRNGWLAKGSSSHRALTIALMVEDGLPGAQASLIYHMVYGKYVEPEPEAACCDEVPAEDCCAFDQQHSLKLAQAQLAERVPSRIRIETTFDGDTGHLSLQGTKRQVEQAKRALLDAAAKLAS